MKLRNNILCLCLLLLIVILTCTNAQDNNLPSELLEKLQANPDIQIKETKVDLMFTQPIDHNHPEKGTFQQLVHLLHKDFSKPVVLWIEGYASRSNIEQEITDLLDANQIMVEHRYFGESIPDSMDWKYLTIKQAADDHHRIVEAFKSIYHGKWVNSGISKGGQTTMYHRRFYPDDVDASVCYVAPLNFSDKEPRVYTFLNNVGDKECRDKILNFQKTVLKKKAELLPSFKDYVREKEYTYKIGLDSAYEYCVLEYPFSFWQWHNLDCEDIPSVTASNDSIFDHLMKGSDAYFFSDKANDYFRSFFYQALTQTGFYGYDTQPFKGLLTKVTNPDFTMALPEGVEVSYDPKPMQDIKNWIDEHGNNMIYIYGEIDPWSASAVELSGKTNALKMVKKGGDHRTRIKSFPEDQKEKILNTLEEWLQVPLNRKAVETEE
ncbi:MAG: S28 family serine protease [Calditrichaceae bacterium]